MSSTELHWLPAHALAAKLRAGEISAVAALDHFGQRVAAINPKLNVLTTTRWEAAQARAREADAAFARGESLGPLHGLPMTVKEGFDVEGIATHVGDPRLVGNIAKQHAVAVRRLHDAGAVIFAKTNVPTWMIDLQTFNSVTGKALNPWDLSRSPGGSSGGAAAALAAGLTPLELGSDLAGSIRAPAHFCGVYGHRPTYNLVPIRGHYASGRPLTPADMCVAGPMARTVEDLELALEILAGHATDGDDRWSITLPRPRRKNLRDYRVAVWLDDAGAPVDDSVKSQISTTAEALRAAGCTVTEGAPDGIQLDDFYPDYFHLMAASAGGSVPGFIYKNAQFWGGFAALLGKDKVQTQLGYARAMTRPHRDWCLADERRAVLKQRIARWFKNVDVLLMPNAQTAALPHVDAKIKFYERKILVNGQPQSYAGQMKWAALAALLGLPATAAPLASEAGLPVGVQIVGPELHDLTTLDFARQLATLRGGFVAPPAF